MNQIIKKYQGWLLVYVLEIENEVNLYHEFLDSEKDAEAIVDKLQEQLEETSIVLVDTLITEALMFSPPISKEAVTIFGEPLF